MNKCLTLCLALTIISWLSCTLNANKNADFAIELKNNQTFVIDLTQKQPSDTNWEIESYDPAYLDIIAPSENKKDQEDDTSWSFYTKKLGTTWLIFRNLLSENQPEELYTIEITI